jgi:hypothetical protein
MKYLKIEDNKGFFYKVESETSTWIEIDQIGKDDLLNLLNKAIGDDFEMDAYSEENLANKAHQIIYKNLHEKFADLLSNKTRFKDESENLYKVALEKYKPNEPVPVLAAAAEGPIIEGASGETPLQNEVT